MIFYCPKGFGNWKWLFSFCRIIAIVTCFAEYKFIAYLRFKRIVIALQGIVRSNKRFNIINVYYNRIKIGRRFSNI